MSAVFSSPPQDYPWRHDLSVFVPPATQTNWSTLNVSTSLLNNGQLTSSGAQNAEIGWDVLLAAGTWSLTLITSKFTNRGIYTALLDGASIGTLDGYDPSNLSNVVQTISGVIIPASGKRRLLLRMATKNASSSSYFGAIQAVGLVRTA